MPALKIADLQVEFLSDNYSWRRGICNGIWFPFQVLCIAPFYRPDFWHVDEMNRSDSWRVYLHVDDWRPTDATLSELKNIGVERNCQPSTICYLEWGNFFYDN
ncbi:hypothetical protein F5B21DRAFT_483375, partial [Xylaria acuta]